MTSGKPSKFPPTYKEFKNMHFFFPPFVQKCYEKKRKSKIKTFYVNYFKMHVPKDFATVIDIHEFTDIEECCLKCN